MRGCRTQESSKFERFWNIVQSTAAEQGKIFFCDCGEGRDFETADMEGEDLFGWLIPQDKADIFEAEWRNGPVDESWSDDIVWVQWDDSTGDITVKFNTY